MIFDWIGCGFHSLGVSHTDDVLFWKIVLLGSTAKVVSNLSSDDISLRGLI